MIQLEKINPSTIEYMPRYFANELVEEYYRTRHNNILVKFKSKLNDDFKSNLKYLCTDFANFCKDKAVLEFVLNHFNLPLRYIEENSQIGIEIRPYPLEYYFTEGMFKSHIMEGKWFLSEKIRNKFLTANQRGNLLCLLECAQKISALVHIFHESGLVIDDLSYKTLLMNPQNGDIFLVSWDGVHKYDEKPNHILPTPDFISPERISLRNIYNFPSVSSNCHALAVLIYMILLHRHPLRGKKIFTEDSAKDEELRLGEKALFVEHPEDKSNEVCEKELMPSELPYGSPNRRPYTLSGPYLSRLFNLAFVKTLHIPEDRPTAKDWFIAIDKTKYSLLSCSNPLCEEGFFVFKEGNKDVCPYCGTQVKGRFPVFNFYSKKEEGKYEYDGFRVIGRDKMVIGEHLLCSNTHADPSSVINTKSGLFLEIKDYHWFLINECGKDVIAINGTKKIHIYQHDHVQIEEGMQLLVTEPDGKLLLVQMLNY